MIPFLNSKHYVNAKINIFLLDGQRSVHMNENKFEFFFVSMNGIDSFVTVNYKYLLYV